MLQDLMLMPDQIVVGDHVVNDGKWWLVVENVYDCPNRILQLVGEDGSKMKWIVFITTENKIRTRPCGSSSRLTERK